MSAPFRVRPFDFGEVFELATPAPADTVDVSELHLRIATLEAELALARRSLAEDIEQARHAAFDAGLAQAREEQGAAILSATDALHAAVENVEERLEEIADDHARDCVEVAQVAAELLAARTLEWAPTGAIDDAIGRVLRQIARGQEVQVAVHPGLVEAIENIIAARQSTDRRRLMLTAFGDPAIRWGDAHIRWDQGGVVLDAAARAEAVRETLAGLLPVPAQTPPSVRAE